MAKQDPFLLPLPSPVEWKPTSTQSEEQSDPTKIIVFRRFQPLKPFIVYLIDPTLNPSTFESFVRQAERTRSYMLYLLRRGPRQHDETLEIALGLLESGTSLFTVFLFELSSLTSISTIAFTMIRRLFQTIFHPSKTIITWNEQYVNMDALFERNYLPRRPQYTAKFILMHNEFKQWYLLYYRHQSTCATVVHSSSALTPCSCDRRRLFSFAYQWTISQAIGSVIKETIDYPSLLVSEMAEKKLMISDKDSAIKSVLHCLAMYKLARLIHRDCVRREMPARH